MSAGTSAGGSVPSAMISWGTAIADTIPQRIRSILGAGPGSSVD
jgi:hypothetical protein